jgi:hypothetical protein
MPTFRLQKEALLPVVERCKGNLVNQTTKLINKMGRKVTKDPAEWMAYQGRLMALVLPEEFTEEVVDALPGKSLNRIRNARKGLVMDMEVLEQLEKISNRERGRRAAAALQPAA